MKFQSLITPIFVPWWKSGLFWRTFVLLAFLICVSMAVWVVSFRLVEREPMAQQVASQVLSIVTITRSALTHSAADSRRELLFDLASNEGIRIYTREPSDIVEPIREDGLMDNVERLLKPRLGWHTKLSRNVNGIDGFWVSFKIDEEDEYWLAMPSSRLEKVANWQWLWWAAAGFILSLMGAGFLSRLINRPLSRLATAARTMATGQKPDPLPVTGSAEVRDANLSFNHMVNDLELIEQERTEILAGISHDLRTPLTRMQLELEMSTLSAEEKNGMEADIRQMDAIVEQFLDYARLVTPRQNEKVNISELIENVVFDAERLPNIKIESKVEPNLLVRGNRTDFERILNNLISNAERYGQTENKNYAEISITCRKSNEEALIEIADKGPGISEGDKERLLRPFTRKDTARSQANGSGLGLAIVNRIIKRYAGKLALKSAEKGGLVVVISFPLILKDSASAKKHASSVNPESSKQAKSKITSGPIEE